MLRNVVKCGVFLPLFGHFILYKALENQASRANLFTKKHSYQQFSGVFFAHFLPFHFHFPNQKWF